jgi:hypothetical protein
MYGAGDVRVEDVADPKLEQPTDALVRIVRACVCGSDLHPYHQMEASAQGVPMGHEFVGVVEAAGSEVSGVKAGDFVISPFAWSDNTCDFCREGFQTSCRHGGFYAANGIAALRPRPSGSRSPTAPWSKHQSPRTPRCCRRYSPCPMCSSPVTTPSCAAGLTWAAP